MADIIKDKKVTVNNFESLSTTMQLDLYAAFKLLEQDVIKVLQEAKSEEDFIIKVQELL